PELPSSGAEIERWRLEVVDRHRVAQDREVGLLLRQSLGELRPRLAAVFAAPHCRRTAWTRPRRGLQRHDVDGVHIVRMHDDGKTEVRWKPLRNRSPGMSIVVAAKHADIWPRTTGARPVRPAAVVLHVEPSRRIVVTHDLVHALAELWIRIRGE